MYADAVFHEQPDWSSRPGRRLALNFLPSTLIVAAVLLTLRLPVVEQSLPLTELVVRILANAVEEVAEPPVEEEPVVEPSSEAPVADVPPVPDVAMEDARKPIDWNAAIIEAVRAGYDGLPRQYSVNPGMDERRRQAATQFAPSRAPVKRPIWENVEKDTLGRSVLRSGNCIRVIDDPNAGSREAFETFGQFIATCTAQSKNPQLLPWVHEIKRRQEPLARYGPLAVE